MTAPSPHPLRVPLAPMSLGDVLDTAFRVLRQRLAAIATVLAVVVVPVDLVAAFSARDLLGGHGFVSLLGGGGLGAASTTAGGPSPVSLVASVLPVIELPLVAGAVATLLAAEHGAEPVTVGAALRRSFRRLPALVVATVCVHLLELVGACLLVLPGLLVMALSVAVAPAIVVEGVGPLRGIRRSWRLCRTRTFGLLGTLLVTGLLASVCSNVVGSPFVVVALAIGTHDGWPLVFLASVLGSLFSVGLNATVAALLHLDGRIRREGYDLEVLAGRLT